jgi:hypothetical protein
MSKEIARVFVFRSDSNPSRTYQTLQYADGSTSCECKGWVFKRRNTPDGQRSCKHTRMVDCGMAQGAAVSMADYLPVTPAPRIRVPQMRQQNLAPKRNRVLYLDTV